MSLKKAAEAVRAAGRGKDTELVHLTRNEVAGLHALAGAAGGKLTRNPKTGMPEAGFLDSLLPTLLGAAANFVVPGSGLVVGGLTGALQNKENPLLGAVTGAMGGYGGGNLASGLQNLGGSAVSPQALAAANASPDAIMSVTAAKDAALANNVLAPQGLDAAKAGLSAAVQDPSRLVATMGGTMPALKAAGMAAAPALAGTVVPGAAGSPFGGDAERSEYNYDAGYTGGEATAPSASSERRWFRPQFTRMAAGGGIGLASGGFVIPADVVSMIGNGSSDAGLEALAKHLGATPIDGGGDGMSDSIPAEIDGQAPAAVARQEAYLSPDKVRAAGGEAKLYELLERVRQAAHGTRQQQRPVEPAEMLG